MARQKGIIKLEGTIGDVSFYKSKDGYLAREKGGIDKERIKTDPAFQRTRENGSEFGRAGKAGRTLRTAFRVLLQKTSDKRVTSRLTKEMLKVIQSDPSNARGERTAKDGNINLLNGFEFNSNGKLSATLYAQYGILIDRVGGAATIDLVDFIAANVVAAPSGATHMKLIAGIGEINFENESFVFAQDSTGEIPINDTTAQNITLQPALTTGTPDDIFVVLGIEFMQEVNGAMYPLKNGAFNPMAIVYVNR